MPRELTQRAREYLGMIPPFMRNAAAFQAIYAAAAGEDELQQQMLDDLEAQLIPATATDLLKLWEAELGITIEPEGATVEQRRDSILAFLRNVTSQGSGLEWSQAAYKLLGNGFTYQKHNPAENRVWDPSFEIPIVPNVGSVTQNNVKNPSFELDTTGWSTAANNQVLAGATVARVADSGSGAGGFAGEVVASAAGQGVTVQVGGFNHGGTMQFRVKLKRVSGAGTLLITYLSADGAYGGVIQSGLAPGDWTEYTGSFVMTGTQAYSLVFKGSGAVTFRVDALLVRSGTDPLPPYFDGSLAPPGAFTEWLNPALPHNSESAIFQTSPWYAGLARMRGPAATADETYNLVPNPRFANDAATWAAINGTSTLSRVTDEFRYGAASGRVVTQGAAAGEGLRTNTFSVGTWVAKSLVPVIFVKAPAGAAMTLVLEERSAADASVGTTPTNFVGTGDWQRVVGAARVLTPGNDDVRILVQNNGTAARTFWLGGAMLNPNGAFSFYFDGSFMDHPNTDGFIRYVSGGWDGTAHLSASAIQPWRRYPPINYAGTIETTTTWAARGTQSLRMVNSAAAGMDSVAGSYFPVTGGKHYSARQTRKINAMPASSAQGQAGAWLFFEDANSAIVGQYQILPDGTGGNGVNPQPRTEPYEDSRVVQAPASAVRGWVMLRLNNVGSMPAGSIDVHFDAVMVAEGVNPDMSALSYGDGDQQGWAWDGPAQLGWDEFNSSTIVGPPPNVIWAFVPYGEGSTAAQLAQTLLRTITPANTDINVSYGGGFILDLSQLDDDLL